MDTQSTISPSKEQPNESPVILEMKNIDKEFPGVRALSNVSLEVRKGEVHALIGENGAGKSTLMKILAGVYTRDAGEILLKGQPVNFTTPHQAQQAGIITIYQELNQVPQLSVLENIYLGSELTRGVQLDWKAMNSQARQLLQKLHLDIDPDQKLGDLGVAQQQMIEIAKALHMKADLIIMDEPTSALSIREIDNLFDIVRELQQHGISVIYISHHLEETFRISDRITVLRDGNYIGTYLTPELDDESLIRLMVGRDLSEKYPKVDVPRGKEVLRVEGLSRGSRLKDISFSAYAGEVLGIAGLVGSGRTELVRAIFGADPVDAGRIYIDGEEVSIRSPQQAIDYGIGLLTEDRKQQGLFLKMSLRDNISMAVLRKLTVGLSTSDRKESELADYYIDKMAIKTSGHDQLAMNLSGGTQQKVVLSKWLSTNPRILIFDEPTRGIDVGAKVEIYAMINQLVSEGLVVLMVSSELPEILGISDRILVLREGRLQAILNRSEATEEIIMQYATGSDKPVAI